jgi:hypothetical protein
MSKHYNLKNIRILLIEGFTEEELRDLCFYEADFRDVHDRCAKSIGKAEIARQLIEYAEQKNLLDTLLILAKQYNPARYEQDQPYYQVALPKRQPALRDFRQWLQGK